MPSEAVKNAVAVQEPPRRSVLADMAERYGMEPGPFEATLRATVVKGACSREEFAAFLLVAKEYDLNPLTKEIYAFPAKGGGIVPVVSVDGWARIINSHPQMDGLTFHDLVDDDTGEVIGITASIHRKDRSRATEATEYMVECRRNTDVWRQWPRRMLRHKSLIQAARYAFGFSGIIDQDEYDRLLDVTPRPKTRALTGGFSTVANEGATAAIAFPDAPEPDGGAFAAPPEDMEPANDDVEAEWEDGPAMVFAIDPEAPEETVDLFPGDRGRDVVDERPTPPSAFDVFAWATELNRDLKLYADGAQLTADWEAHAEELHAAMPSLATSLKRAVQARRAAINKENAA